MILDTFVLDVYFVSILPLEKPPKTLIVLIEPPLGQRVAEQHKLRGLCIRGLCSHFVSVQAEALTHYPQ